MEVVEISREERDVYLIPQNFVDTGTILGVLYFGVLPKVMTNDERKI